MDGGTHPEVLLSQTQEPSPASLKPPPYGHSTPLGNLHPRLEPTCDHNVPITLIPKPEATVLQLGSHPWSVPASSLKSASAKVTGAGWDPVRGRRPEEPGEAKDKNKHGAERHSKPQEDWPGAETGRGQTEIDSDSEEEGRVEPGSQVDPRMSPGAKDKRHLSA